jgi:phosphoribosylformylglycinamidine synthase
VLRQLIRAGTLASAHDCSEGGLGVALAECCLGFERPIGARVKLESGSLAPHAFLFGEDASRAVVSFAAAAAPLVLEACARAGVPCSLIGDVGGDELVIEGILSVPVKALSKAWRSGIPGLLRP